MKEKLMSLTIVELLEQLDVSLRDYRNDSTNKLKLEIGALIEVLVEYVESLPFNVRTKFIEHTCTLQDSYSNFGTSMFGVKTFKESTISMMRIHTAKLFIAMN